MRGRLTDEAPFTYVQLVDPEREIDPGALAVHGISREELIGAPRFEEIAPTVRELLEGTAIVGHNVTFDVGFLAAEWRRLRWDAPRCYLIDTLSLARRWLGLDRNHLSHVARYLGVPVASAHRALGDAQMTWHVLRALVRRLEGSGLNTLADLISAQGGPIPWPRPDLSGLPASLREALLNGSRVIMHYVDQTGQITRRLIDILDCGDEYLIAYCHLRQAQRTFRLDRILRVEPAGEEPDPSLYLEPDEDLL
ncbi:MAG: exonuclease domain-containing protein [Anaerolineae bacterium]